MLKLYSNRSQTFKCKVKIEGNNFKAANPRLIVRGDDGRTSMYEGLLVLNECTIEIPPLNRISPKGEATLEIVVDNILFQPYHSEYQLVQSGLVGINEITIKAHNDNQEIMTEEIEEEYLSDGLLDDINEIKEVRQTKPKSHAQKTPAPKKHKFFKDSVSSDDIKLVKNFIAEYEKMDETDKKILTEYAAYSYRPSKKAFHWASNVFKDPESDIALICMSKFEDMGKKKRPHTKMSKYLNEDEFIGDELYRELLG